MPCLSRWGYFFKLKLYKMRLLSDCCGAEATDPIMEDYGICPECKDHCQYEKEQEPSDDQIYNTFNCEGGINF
jgi:hypothetical protein